MPVLRTALMSIQVPCLLVSGWVAPNSVWGTPGVYPIRVVCPRDVLRGVVRGIVHGVDPSSIVATRDMGKLGA
jgi:hypothetical protein